MAGDELTARQARFAEEYLLDANAAAAYRRAGYKVTTDGSAESAASRLLSNVKVAERVAALQKARSAATGITAEWALRRLKIEAEYGGDGSSHSARVSAVGLAMKHLSLLADKAEVTVRDSDAKPPVDPAALAAAVLAGLGIRCALPGGGAHPSGDGPLPGRPDARPARGGHDAGPVAGAGAPLDGGPTPPVL